MSVDKLAALLSSAVVTVAVVAGLVVSGLPSEQRLMRLDKSRVSDLRRLSSAVDDYWQDKNEPPKTLAQTVDGRRLNRLPSDPISGIPYEYHIDGSRTYRLCAQFDRASSEEEKDNFWSHPQGQNCYSMEVEIKNNE